MMIFLQSTTAFRPTALPTAHLQAYYPAYLSTLCERNRPARLLPSSANMIHLILLPDIKIELTHSSLNFSLPS